MTKVSASHSLAIIFRGRCVMESCSVQTSIASALREPEDLYNYSQKSCNLHQLPLCFVHSLSLTSIWHYSLISSAVVFLFVIPTEPLVPNTTYISHKPLVIFHSYITQYLFHSQLSPTSNLLTKLAISEDRGKFLSTREGSVAFYLTSELECTSCTSQSCMVLVGDEDGFRQAPHKTPNSR